MKAVVILSLICACAAMPQTFIADTPEVYAEKKRFFELYNAAAKAAADAPDINVDQQGETSKYKTYTTKEFIQRFNVPYNPTHYKTTHYKPAQYKKVVQYTPKYKGPLASTIPAGLPGSTSQVENTPEVEAAIANFKKAYDAALFATRSDASSPQYQHSYTPVYKKYKVASPSVQP